MKIEIPSLLDNIFAKSELLYASLSSPRQKAMQKKINIRPILVKKETRYQIVEQRGNQAFHQNVSVEECQKFLLENLSLHFKQALLCTPEADYQILCSTPEHITILKKPPTKAKKVLSHNRPKQYLLEEGSPIPFLIELGVMTAEGKVIAKKSDKFRQLNRFLEIIDDVLSSFDGSHPLHIIDFGCGKAYLTFALYHYLTVVKGWSVNIKGLDLKEDVITHCQSIANKLSYAGLHFAVGDINQYQPTEKVDMVITLHACDTATDAALEKAIRWNSNVILCVPCCQHELFNQIHNTTLDPLLQHGILKERFTALATDAARAQLLDILGYQTQVLEFIDLEHTPKNLLIRATKRKSKKPIKKSLEAYLTFKEALKITPSLEKRFHKELFEENP